MGRWAPLSVIPYHAQWKTREIWEIQSFTLHFHLDKVDQKVSPNLHIASVVKFSLNVFHLLHCCFYLSCTDMCDKQLQQILYEIALCCAMFCVNVTQRVYLYNIGSIKRMWNRWKIIRTSNSTIWHLTVRIDSQGYTEYKVFCPFCLWN